LPDPLKDRELTLPIAPGRAEILYLRSSEHPLTYAIILRVMREGGWEAVLSVDNSHERADVDAHHVHRYARGAKLAPEPLPFHVDDTNDAMAKAIEWMADNWEELSQ
jgi:hypothetical protein